MIKNYPIIILLAALVSLSAQAQTYYVTDKVLVGVYETASTESNLIKALPSGTPIEILERNEEFARVRSPDGTTGWIESSYLIDHKPAQLVVLELTDKQQQANEQASLLQAELEATQKQLIELKKSASKDNKANDAKQAKEIERLQKQAKTLDSKLAAANKQLENKASQQKALEKQVQQMQDEMIALRKNKPAATEADVATEPAEAATAPVADAALQAENAQLRSTLDQLREVLSLPATPNGVIEDDGVRVKLIWIVIGILVLLAGGFIGGIKWLDWRNLQRHGGFRI